MSNFKTIYGHVHILEALATDEDEFYKYLSSRVPFDLIPAVIHGLAKDWNIMMEIAKDLKADLDKAK